MESRDFRESMLIVISGILGAIMAKAVDIAWGASLFAGIFTLLLASILVFFLAHHIIKSLPKK